ncbi:hypothetical protein [Rheinheimera sp. NSM]|uniref:hypothetical protein n=1 Tax=Rheinheimera sp. NSM TaxID=3457884 RepID=UPI004036BF81
MTQRTGGGAATNSGIDFQQRVAAFFVLSMGLDLDCASMLEREHEAKICKVSFETEDAVDDIVISHERSKTYLQVKRKLSLSDKANSEFYKTIDQFVRQYKASQNKCERYVIVTSNDSSRKILSDLRKITISARLNDTDLQDNPISKSEELTYKIFLSCISRSLKKNGFVDNDIEFIRNLIRKIHVIALDIENNGSYEKAFLASISSQLSTNPKLLWGYLISKTLDWSKERQSVDIAGINSVIKKFVKRKDFDNGINQDNSSFFQVHFDPDKYNICSGREVVIIDSFLPEFDIVLLELYRFDDNGEFRLKFHDREIEMGGGSKYKLYGRFSTYSGAKRFIEEQEWIQDKKIMLVPINGEYDFDSSPIAVAYSEKVRNKVLGNKEVSKCIHCQGGLSNSSILIEVNEEGLPFDAGMIHQRCLRESDRVLGIANNPGMDEHPELQNFDYQRWFLSLDHGQALWAGFSAFNQPIKRVLWNSKSSINKGGHLCIKAVLDDGGVRYVQERGRVQRYDTERAELVCSQLNNWIEDSKENGNPLCYSLDGDIQGMHDDIQNNSSRPVDLIECLKFEITQYTRGISQLHDKVKNFYAPLVSFVDIKSDHLLLVNNSAFLVTTPMDLKGYLKNWSSIGFTYESYKLNIIETDDDFDRFMICAAERGFNVLVDPLFNKSGELLKGAIIEDMESLNNEANSTVAHSVLFTIDNKNGTFTHLFRDFDNDLTLLLNSECTSDTCNCMGCQMYTARVQIYGQENLDIRRTSDTTIALNLGDSNTDWEESFIEDNKVSWSDWESVVFQQEV